MIAAPTRLAAGNGPDSRCTVGELTIPGASRNVSPGQVDFTLDLREASLETLDALEASARALLERIAGEQGLAVSIREFWSLPPCPFDAGCLATIRKAAEMSHLEIRPRTLVSGAGHDAVYVSRVAPAAMIFVPSENGLSHNECEYTSPEQLTKGCNVLLNTLITAANRA